MEFLNPNALYGFLALPLLLLPYLIRRKPQRFVFSSVLLFAQQASGATARPWSRLRLPPIFFLQLLLLVLLILALGEPVFSVRVSNIAIVMDNSASMQALEQGTTRFAAAQEKARNVLADLGATGSVDLYVTLPHLARVTTTALSPLEAASMVASLEPYDLPDVSVDYDTVLKRLAQDLNYERIYLITDRPAHGQSGILRVLTLGHAQGNLAVASFSVGRSSLANSQLEATVMVTNFSSQNQRIKVLLRGSGTLLATRELTLAEGQSGTVWFQGFPGHPYYEAEIDARDALTLDNRRFAVPSHTRTLKILGVSPRPQALTSLRRIAGVSIDVISPSDYDKADRSGYGLEIFHLSSPATLSGTPALLVLPPESNPLVELEKPVARVVVSQWREAHLLTRYINFALFRPPWARPFKPKTPGETLIESPEGGLVFVSEHQRVRYLVLGFDPFPYLGRENLPISIFTLNFLDWFIEKSATEGNATGEPISIGTADQGAFILTPKGEKQPLRPGSSGFSNTFFQGIYQLNHGKVRELFAVNLHDTSESNLSEPVPIELRDEGNTHSRISTLFFLWPSLLLLSLLFFVIEWFLVPRVVRPRYGTRTERTEAA